MGEKRNVGYLVIINEDRVWFLLVLPCQAIPNPSPILGVYRPLALGVVAIRTESTSSVRREETVRISAATFPGQLGLPQASSLSCSPFC